MKTLISSLLLLSLILASSRVRMLDFRPDYRNYGDGVAFEYGNTLTAGQTNAWIVIPPVASSVTIYLTMTGTTNSGIVEFTAVPYDTLTNTETGWVWDLGQVSVSTNASFIYPGSAVRVRCISNTVSIYVIARVK